MKLLVVCVSLLYIVTAGNAKNPGLCARITRNGLSYANTVALEALKTRVEQITIPDQGGEAGSLKYHVTNMHVTEFTPPKSSLTTTPGKGLTWAGSGAAIAVDGNVEVKELIISDSEKFRATVTDVSFNLTIDIGEDSTGRPTLSSQLGQCSVVIGNVGFEFDGHLSWLLDIFKKDVENSLKTQLNGQLCKLIDVEINTDSAKKLASLPVTVPLAESFLLDYSLIDQPLITSAYMETQHKGEVYWRAASAVEAPLEAPAMAKTSEVDQMVYFWVSDFVLNTMMYQGQKHNFLAHNLTAEDLPSGSRGVLNTTCSGLIPRCVGAIITEIGKKYPESQVELHINSTAMPKMTITTAGASVSGTATINMYAQVPGRKDTPFLLTLDAKLDTTVDVTLTNELLYAKVKDLNVNLKAGKSAIGEIDAKFLSFIIDEALKVYFIPKLNEIGEKGFPLPVVDGIKFVNSRISFAQDTIMVATDLQYTPASSGVDDKSGPLKFIPHNAFAAKSVHVHGEH